MVQNKVSFKAKVDGKEVELAVERPSPRLEMDGDIVYSVAVRDGLSSGGTLRAEVDYLLKQKKGWTKQVEDEIREAQNSILKDEATLKKGGITVKEGEKLAKKIREQRFKMIGLRSVRTGVESTTVESLAENQRFNFYVANCTVYNESGDKVFKDVEDYLAKSREDYAVESATKLAKLLYGMDEDIQKNFVENQFLRKFGFMDDKYRLINKDGHLVSADGKLIDEDGRYVDENDKFVDVNGNPVDKDGAGNFDGVTFLDDDGKPLSSTDTKSDVKIEVVTAAKEE